MLKIELTMQHGFWAYVLEDSASQIANVGHFASADRALSYALHKMELRFNDSDTPGMEIAPGQWFGPDEWREE